MSEPGANNAAVGNTRWVLPVVLLVSVVIAYLDRLNIALALPKIAKQYHWTAEQMDEGGLLLSIFFIGYGIANIVFSPLAERFGPKRSLITAVTFFCLFTAMGGIVGHVYSVFLASRLLLGLGEGVHFPMNSKLIKTWFPVSERSRANGIWIAGVMIATIVAPLALVPIIGHFGWRAMFVGLGVMGMAVTLPLLYFFVFDTPRGHPRISEAEADYIEAGMEDDEPEAEGFWDSVKPFLKDKTYWIALFAGRVQQLRELRPFDVAADLFHRGQGRRLR